MNPLRLLCRAGRRLATETTESKWAKPFAIIAMLLAVVFFALTAGASNVEGPDDEVSPVSTSIWDQTFTVAPFLTTATIVVHWSTPAQVTARCGPGAGACINKAGEVNGELFFIWAVRPRSFSDDNVCRLGHEVVHALGGRHRRKRRKGVIRTASDDQPGVLRLRVTILAKKGDRYRVAGRDRKPCWIPKCYVEGVRAR